ncbi:MAG: threonine synthase [Tissierellia bacterium]|nr:threonine synthase [Tissierellia bacterium]
MKFYCSKCKSFTSIDTLKPACDCGGLWELKHELPPFNYNDIENDIFSMFRYNKFMPKLNSWRDVSLGEGMTSIVKLEEILVKMDYMMPTLSYKDRGAAVLISHVKDLGVDFVVQDSSGNAGNSIAAYAARAGIKCEIYVPENTSPKKIEMIKSHGAKVIVVKGSRDHCAEVCREKVFTEGAYYANHVYNPLFYQGTKTFIYEVYEELGYIPKNIFLPVGNGTLFLGAVFGLEELLNAKIIETMPNIFVIQSEKCDPIYQAYLQKSTKPAAVLCEATMAEGIAIGKPMRGEEILEKIYKYDFEVLICPESEILGAREYLAKRGIYAEHTSAAILGAYRAYEKKFGKLEEVLIPITGAGLKSDH